MLSALKIGLLALLPLSVSHSGNSWTLTSQEASYQLTNTFEYISSNSLYDKITLVYNEFSYTFDASKRSSVSLFSLCDLFSNISIYSLAFSS